MNCEIVPTKEEHIEGFWKVLDNVARERRYIAFLEGPPMERFRSFVLGNIKRKAPQFVALMEGKVVGWCDIVPSDRPVHAHCGVLGMGLLAGHRDKGIGAALMQMSLDAARSCGLTRVSLTVYEGNARALEFYKKVGFRIEGVKQKDALIDGVYINVISMALLFEDQDK
jgi:ribosomal protein S18 acetylase RimI-like enzyme